MLNGGYEAIAADRNLPRECPQFDLTCKSRQLLRCVSLHPSLPACARRVREGANARDGKKEIEISASSVVCVQYA